MRVDRQPAPGGLRLSERTEGRVSTTKSLPVCWQRSHGLRILITISYLLGKNLSQPLEDYVEAFSSGGVGAVECQFALNRGPTTLTHHAHPLLKSHRF